MLDRHRGLIPLLGALGCTPSFPVDSAAPACFDEPPEAGQARVKLLNCSGEVPRNGDVRGTDFLLQNALVTLGIRHTGASLSLVGAPGGTVLDFAPHGWNDRLIEAVPIVQGGWIASDEADFGVDEGGAWLRLRGPMVSAVGLDADGGLDAGVFERGEEVELLYRLAPDSLVLEIEGAEGLYLHGDRQTVPVRDGFYHAGLAYLTDASAMEDLGGAQRLQGVSRLAVGLWADAPGAISPDGPHASGVCDGDEVEVYGAGGVLLGLLDPEFDQVLPVGAATLSCVAEGRAPGEPKLIGEDLNLEAGGEGWLWLRVSDERGEDIPALLSWSGGRFAVPPGGGPAPLGAGSHTLTVSHGPAYEPVTLTLTVEGEASASVVLHRSITAEGWTQADLWRQATPSREQRAEPAEDLRLAAAEGARFVVQSALDEVGQPYTDSWEGQFLRARAGSLARSESAGEVLSWSWSANRRFSGHGAVPWFGLSASDLLASAMTAGAPDRLAVVDASWVAAASYPAGWDPRPDLMRLRSTADFPSYFALLQRGVRLGVAGPVTWIDTGVEGQASAAACEQGLVLGRSVASSGPLLTLESAGQGIEAGTIFSLHLEATRSAQVEAVELWVDGEPAGRWPVVRRDDEPFEVRSGTFEDFQWAVAVAVGGDWAATSPLWSP